MGGLNRANNEINENIGESREAKINNHNRSNFDKIDKNNNDNIGRSDKANKIC